MCIMGNVGKQINLPRKDILLARRDNAILLTSLKKLEGMGE